jgi:hypothetical protein
MAKHFRWAARMEYFSSEKVWQKAMLRPSAPGCSSKRVMMGTLSVVPSIHTRNSYGASNCKLKFTQFSLLETGEIVDLRELVEGY